MIFSQSSRIQVQEDQPDTLTISSSHEMCKFCFDIVIGELVRGDKRNVDFDIDSSIESPLFVTWEITRNSSYHLRGCIGTLAPQPVSSSLGEYAKTSAFKDPRFHPIAISEVPFLRVSVSMLVQYEDCENCLDWTPGVHGVIINFSLSSKRYNGEFDDCLRINLPFSVFVQDFVLTCLLFILIATYLPEVAADQGWSQLETIKSLVQKSGFRGQLTNEILSRIQCTRYQSSKKFLTYEEYTKMDGASTVNDVKNNETNSKSGGWLNSFG